MQKSSSSATDPGGNARPHSLADKRVRARNERDRRLAPHRESVNFGRCLLEFNRIERERQREIEQRVRVERRCHASLRSR